MLSRAQFGHSKYKRMYMCTSIVQYSRVPYLKRVSVMIVLASASHRSSRLASNIFRDLGQLRWVPTNARVRTYLDDAVRPFKGGR